MKLANTVHHRGSIRSSARQGSGANMWRVLDCGLLVVYGRSIGMGIRRSTFIIGPDGTIARAFKKVSPKTHDDVILKALGELADAA